MTRQRTTIIRIRWDRIARIALGLALAVAGFAVIWSMLQLASEPSTGTTVPACTDEIADAGGICIGEPR